MIYAESTALYSRQAFGYRFDQTGTPRQIGVVDVFVRQTTTGGFLPLAGVEFTPQTLGMRGHDCPRIAMAALDGMNDVTTPWKCPSSLSKS